MYDIFGNKNLMLNKIPSAISFVLYIDTDIINIYCIRFSVSSTEKLVCFTNTVQGINSRALLLQNLCFEYKPCADYFIPAMSSPVIKVSYYNWPLAILKHNFCECWNYFPQNARW